MTLTRPMDRRKPDPSEPWRYVCVECYSTSLKLVRGEQARHDADPEAHTHRDSERRPRVYCDGCNKTRYYVRDRKESERTTVTRAKK